MMKNIAKIYLHSHQKRLLTYTLVTVLFSITNFIFFRHSIDVPVDLLFLIIYVIFIPSIVVFITLLKTDLTNITDNLSAFKILFIHSIIPVLITLVSSSIYVLIRLNINDFINIVTTNLFAFPLIFVAIILAIEIKSGFDYLGVKILVVVVLFILYWIATLIFSNYEYWTIYIGINVVFTYIIPLLIILIYSRSKLIDSML